MNCWLAGRMAVVAVICDINLNIQKVALIVN